MKCSLSSIVDMNISTFMNIVHLRTFNNHDRIGSWDNAEKNCSEIYAIHIQGVH